MSTPLRPLSASELLDRTFFLYRNNFVVFAGIAALADLPVLALRLGNSALIITDHAVPRPLATLILLLASLVAVGVLHAATVVAVSDLHLGRSTSIRSAYAGSRRSMFRAVWISLVISVVCMIIGGFAAAALAAVLIPMSVGRLGAVPVVMAMVVLAGFGLASYWWVPRALVVPVTVLEGTGLVDSIDRSKMLTEDRRWRVFAIWMLVLVLFYAITLLFESPAYWIGGFHFVHGHLISSHWAAAIMSAGSFVGTSLAGPLMTIAITLVYYDGRVRKEAFDLELMMANLSADSASERVSQTV